MFIKLIHQMIAQFGCFLEVKDYKLHRFEKLSKKTHMIHLSIF